MNKSKPLTLDDEELNLSKLIAALRRRWLYIAAGVAFGGIASAWQTARIPTTWEGNFQIVFSSGNNGNELIGGNSLIASLVGSGAGGTRGNEIETEIKILESPSVLRPIFERIRSRRASLSDNSADHDEHAPTSNIEVKAVRGTSILEVTYRNTDKSLIIPVLEEVSRSYQDYSLKERRESLQSALDFARSQLNRSLLKSKQSYRAFDDYRLRYGIASSGSSAIGSSVDIGSLLNQSAAGSAVQIQGNGINSPASQGDPLGQLAAINLQLISARQTYTEQDPSIQALIRQRDALKRYLETTAIGTLTLPGEQSPTKEQTRSIMQRYLELERVANRDTATVNSFESAVHSLQLEQARSGKPWKLISTPTLQDRPVAPRPMRNLAIGLFSGLVLGCGAALAVENRSGRVFNPDEINELLDLEPLAVLAGVNQDGWVTTLRLLSDGPLAGTATLALVPVGSSIDNACLTELKNTLQILLPQCRISGCSNLAEASSSAKQLLVTAPGAATRAQLTQIRQQLDLLSQPISGWLLIEAA